MGYVTRFDGQITIDPPLAWAEIKDSPFLPEAAQGDDYKDVMFVFSQRQVDTEQGFLHVRVATALAPTWEDEMRGYSIVEHVQEVIDAYPDHEFGGRFDCFGEETGDLWRLEIHDRRAVKVQPRIVWPDDED